MNHIKTTSYFKRISKGKSHLEKQFLYSDRERSVKPYESLDPLGEKEYKITPRLIHRYKNRVLLLVTARCRLYCRHCFRRDFIDSMEGDINNSELFEALEYIKVHGEVKEILISGGDPLILSAKRLKFIMKSISKAREDIVIRVGTRVPVVAPKSIKKELIKAFKVKNPVWFSIQCNHPDELTDEVFKAVKRLRGAGISLVNQSVLLKGVNDSVPVLKKLSEKLLQFNIKPYYIFQGDLARGTSHLRVPITRGISLMSELRSEVSGLGMPTYAVDIPGGGGKVPINGDSITGEDDEWIYLTNDKGFTGKYPKE